MFPPLLIVNPPAFLILTCQTTGGEPEIAGNDRDSEGPADRRYTGAWRVRDVRDPGRQPSLAVLSRDDEVRGF
jgi:hypothetical protein